MPMVLTGDDGVEFELALIHDRLGNLDDDDNEDAGYPILSFRVGTEDDSWEETAPSINLFELHTLAEWLEAVAADRPDVERVELLEINLSFDVEDRDEEAVVLVVGFHLENRPDWAIIDAPTDEAGFIRLRVTRESLGEAALELREDLADTSADRG